MAAFALFSSECREFVPEYVVFSSVKLFTFLVKLVLLLVFIFNVRIKRLNESPLKHSLKINPIRYLLLIS